MRSHLMTECLNANMICSVCDTKEKRSKIGSHSCVELLKTKLKEKEAELTKEKAEKEALTKRVKELEIENSSLRQAGNSNSRLKCKHGH